MDQQDGDFSPEPSTTSRYLGLEQMVCIALADAEFAAQLITDPGLALARTSHTLDLTSLEHALAESITQAADIHEYAARLHQATREQGRQHQD